MSRIPGFAKAAAALVSAELPVAAGCILVSALFPQALLASAVLMVCFWWLRWYTHRQCTLRTPADFGIISLAGIALINLTIHWGSQETYLQTMRLFNGLLLYYAAANWIQSASRLQQVFLGIAGLALGLSLYGMIGVEWTVGKMPIIPPTVYQLIPHWAGDVIHRNVLAGALIILLPCTISPLLFGWRSLNRTGRVSFLLASLVGLGILVLTQSRGAIIAAGLAFCLLLALRWRWGWILLPFAAFAGGFAIILWGASQVSSTVETVISLEGLPGRLWLWERAIYLIQAFPYTGVGLGRYGDTAQLLYPFPLYWGVIPHAHNLFLQIAVDLGIPGLVAWLTIFLALSKATWAAYRASKSSQAVWVKTASAALLACLAALLIHGITDSVTWGMVRPAPLAWGLMGIAAATARLSAGLVPGKNDPVY